jgi:hypothetical protein
MKISKTIPTLQNHIRQLSALPARTAALLLAAALALAGTARAELAATLIDYGATAPIPGVDDCYQLTTGSGSPDGLNYYFDNSTPPGQTFTTGTVPNGYVLNSLYIATAGNSGGLPAGGQAYLLRLYTVSGSTATLVTTFRSQAGFVFTDLDWLQWADLNFGLQPNTQYAYSFARTTAGWENMANVSGNLYTGGEVALIPTAGGTMTLGSSHQYDAAFDVALSVASSLTVNPPEIAPANAVTMGTAVTISSAPAVGPGPIGYRWQTDGGGGGVLTNIPSATGTSLAVNTTGFAPGNYRYAIVATNSSSTVTSAVATLTVYLVSGATLTDVGTVITPGLNDISQLTGGGTGDGLNYYDDNNPPPGQTFTTDTNSQGYYLTSVTVGTGGGGSSGTGLAQPYDLFIYLVEGANATLLADYTNASFIYTYGDWLTWSGFPPLVLKPNTTYAYAFGNRRYLENSYGWAGMTSTPNTADLYAGGQLCLIPRTGGAMTFGSTGLSDAAFDLGLSPVGVGPSPYPYVYSIAFSPARTVVAGTTVTLSEAATGTAPLHYRWRTDGGTGGTLINIPSSDATNLVVDTTGWMPRAYKYDVVVTNQYGSATSAVATLTLTYADTTAVLTDIGTVDPLPLMDEDPAQLFAGGGAPDGLNYYLDNGSPPGQMFTTYNDPNGYTLTSLAVRTGTGDTGGLPAGGQAYVLRLYTVSGITATLYATYTSQTNFTFVHSDWLRWSGLAVPLAQNTTYAYSFARIATGSGWENMSSTSGNPYVSGEVALIPTGGGTMTLGSSHDYDGTFVVGLAVPGRPNVSPAFLSPANTVYAGSPVTASATVTGTGPFTYQWQTDGGFTGTLINIPGATNTTLSVGTTGLDGLLVAYRLVASNGSGSTTGEVAVLTVNVASAPFVLTGFDTTPASASRFGGGAVTFTASFDGTRPIAYRWQVDKGTGYTNIVGRTNTSLVLTNLKLSDAGTYTLYASNSVGTGNSSGATLTVYPQPAGPVTVNFQWHSTEGGDAGTYAGAGIPGFGTGTYWNQITGPSYWSPGTYSSLGGYADDGITDCGMSCTLTTGGSWSQTAGSMVPLLDSYAMAYTGTPRPFTFGFPNGLYNIALFSCNGSEVSTANAGTVFTLNGIAKTAIPTQHTSFVRGDTCVIFSNVVVTATSLSGTWDGVAGKSFGCFNGAQLRYLGSVNATPPNISAQFSGGQLNMAWPSNPGWTLQAQTNTAGAGLGTNWVDVAGSSEATRISLPVNPDNGSVFYRLILRQ